MKRKGFMIVELLMIIGILISGLAGVFIVYKKIQANLASSAIVTDMATIMNGLDRYKGATGGYPYSTTQRTLMSDPAFTWNAGSAYIDKSTANKWYYYTLEKTEKDPDTNTATGQILIVPDTQKYSALKATEILDILRGKCLNGKKAVGNSVASFLHTNICVIYSNVLLYDDNNDDQ